MNFPSFHRAVPVISTNDIAKSLTYYINVLGFSPDFEFGNPVVYAGVKSGSAEIYFAYDPYAVNMMSEKNYRPEIFIWLSDAGISFEKHKANGAEVVEPISDRPWGAKQYVIRDVNGYYLKFAQPL